MKPKTQAYRTLHNWVNYKLGQPLDCNFCGIKKLPKRNYHWANKSHQYKRELDDWLRLCAKCHKSYDMGKSVNECSLGHSLTPDNVYKRYDGYLECRICRREAKRKYYARKIAKA